MTPLNGNICLLRRTGAAFSGVSTEVCFCVFDILLAVDFFFYLQRMNGADALSLLSV